MYKTWHHVAFKNTCNAHLFTLNITFRVTLTFIFDITLKSLSFIIYSQLNILDIILSKTFSRQTNENKSVGTFKGKNDE